MCEFRLLRMRLAATVVYLPRGPAPSNRPKMATPLWSGLLPHRATLKRK